MKNLTLIPCFALVSLCVSAGNLKIACGENAYDALESGRGHQAEIYLEAKTKGPNNPILVKELLLKDNDLTDMIFNIHSELSKKEYDIHINLDGYHSFEFKNIKDCSDLDFASGEVTFSKYVGGFLGSEKTYYNCSCLK